MCCGDVVLKVVIQMLLSALAESSIGLTAVFL